MSTTSRAALFIVTAISCLLPTAVRANGVLSHIHISDLARDELPPGDVRDLLSDPDVLEAYRAGSVFPDTGYAAEDPYGEMAHWEPFTDAFVQHIREHHPPPFESVEARRLVAFLMGVASHSMADQWFDSLFMARCTQWDGDSGQLDVGAETWLVVEQAPDAHITGWLDAVTMNRIFDERLDYEPGAALLEEGMESIVGVIEFLYGFSDSLYDTYWYQMPWAATHYYLGLEAPGSLPHIAEVVALYWQVLWARLHGTDVAAQSFLMTWPPDGHENFDVDHTLIETRMAVAFGHGIDRDTLTAENVQILGADAVAVPSATRFIYGSEFGNVVLVRPDADLDYDTEYTVSLGTGLRTMDDRALPEAVTFTFRTRCAPDRLEECPPLPEPWEEPDGPPPRPDAGPDADADVADADQPGADADPPTLDADPSDADAGLPDGGRASFDAAGGCGGCSAVNRCNAPRWLQLLP